MIASKKTQKKKIVPKDRSCDYKFTWQRKGGKLRFMSTFSGLPMIVETAVVASEKTGLVSTPSRLRLVVM